MKAVLNVENNKVRGSNLQLNVVETLIIEGALKDFTENPENHPADIRLATQMIEDLIEGFLKGECSDD